MGVGGKGAGGVGGDRKKTVVNPHGETHDVKNLYVVDASLLPTSIGYNPSETVYALAHYVCEQMIKAQARARRAVPKRSSRSAQHGGSSSEPTR